jgi:hypothetical protein
LMLAEVIQRGFQRGLHGTSCTYWYKAQ